MAALHAGFLFILLSLCHYSHSQGLGTDCPSKTPGADGFYCVDGNAQFYQTCGFGTTINEDDPVFRCVTGKTCDINCPTSCTTTAYLPCKSGCTADKNFYCVGETSFVNCVDAEATTGTVSCLSPRVCSNNCNSACQTTTPCAATTTTSAGTITTSAGTVTTSAGTVTTSAGSNTTSASATTTSAPPAFKCTKSGNFPDATDCTRYFRCYPLAAGGFDVVHATCSNKPTVSYWDIDELRCNSDVNVCLK